MSQPPSPEPPPPEPPPPEPPQRPYYGAMPLPPISGEILVFLVVWLVAAIITLASDDATAFHFLVASVALAVGYMLARGIAKAGKALEGR